MFSRLRSKLGELRENVRQMRDRPAAPSPSPVVERSAAPVASAPASAPAPASGSLAARAAALANGAAPALTSPAPVVAEVPAAATAAPVAAPTSAREETPAEPQVAAPPAATKASKAAKTPRTKAAPEAATVDVAPEAEPTPQVDAAPPVKAAAEPAAETRTAPETTAPAKTEPKAASKTDGAASKLHADTASTTLEAYIARAKANNRDLSTITGGVGRNVAADGAAYEGPVDNESSRAKAAGKVLTIDQWECISCGTCVEQTEHVFFLPSEEDAKATPIAQEGPMDLIQDAIDACPVTCISWTSKDEAEERGLATGEGWTAPT
jgi:ferredoxin